MMPFCFSWATVVEGGEVTIQLQRRVQLSADAVTLADIAEIRGATLEDQTRLENLDLATKDLSQPELTISREQVRVRLALESIPSPPARILGGPCTVLWKRPWELTSENVAKEITRQLADAWSMSTEDIRVDLQRPQVISTGFSTTEPGDYRLELFAPSQPIWGQKTLTVALYDGPAFLWKRGVPCRIAFRERVAVALQTLPPGTVLTASHVALEPKWLETADFVSAPEVVVGLATRKTIRAGEPVDPRNVTTPKQSSPEIVVRPRDAVRVIARKGRLLVTIPQAEALQGGAVGQLIRVRNTQSNRVITGRIAGPGEVVIDLP
ncbi:MAG: flagellar basal body P-ring formation protein FlgA [Planctomycetaceae bacterium]|nr:flagellar basal body P-ring formation protein FlgA [Planctomycetaceae bacterium]